MKKLLFLSIIFCAYQGYAQKCLTLTQVYEEKCEMLDTTVYIFPPSPNAGSWAQEYALIDSVRRIDTLSNLNLIRYIRTRIFKKAPTGDPAYTMFSYFNGQPVGTPLTPEELHNITLANELTSICGDFSKHQLSHAELFGIPAISISSGYHDQRRTEGHVQTLVQMVVSPGDTIVTIEDAMFDMDFCGLDSVPLSFLKLAKFVFEDQLYDSVLTPQSGTPGLFVQNDPCPNSTACSYRDTHREVDSVQGSQFWDYKVRAERGIETYTSGLGCGCEGFRKILKEDYGISDSLNMDCGGAGDAREFAKVMVYGFRGMIEGGHQPQVFQETIDSFYRMRDRYISPCLGIHPVTTPRPWPGMNAILDGATTFDAKLLKVTELVLNQFNVTGDSTLISSGLVRQDTGWSSVSTAWNPIEYDSTVLNPITAAKYLALYKDSIGADSVGLYYIGDTISTLKVYTVFYTATNGGRYIAVDPISGVIFSDSSGTFSDVRQIGYFMKTRQFGSIYYTGVYFGYSYANYLTRDSCDRNAVTNPWITPGTGTTYRTRIPGVLKIKSARTMDQEFLMNKNEWLRVSAFHHDPHIWNSGFDMVRGLACMQRIEGLPGLESQLRQLWASPWQ